MFMWNVGTDKTSLYLSHLDYQDRPGSGTYQTVTGEQSEVGDGTTKTFSGNLAFKSRDGNANCFDLTITAPTGTSKTITEIPNALNPQITAASHGLSTG